MSNVDKLIEKVKNLGSEIFTITSYTKNPLKNSRDFMNIIKKKKPYFLNLVLVSSIDIVKSSIILLYVSANLVCILITSYYVLYIIF